MTPNVLGLCANLVSNFVTVVVPAPRWNWDRSKIDHAATLSEIDEYRLRFRRELSRHGETRCLDCVEIDVLGQLADTFLSAQPGGDLDPAGPPRQGFVGWQLAPVKWQVSIRRNSSRAV